MATASPSTSGPASARWPADASPERSPIYSRSEVLIPVPPARAFAWLVRAELWPRWYSQCGRVAIVSGPRSDLGIGSHFRWTVLGVPVSTTVAECEPPVRLAWNGSGLGARAYHSWDIEPAPGGCRVVTEETQRGAIPSVARWLLRPLLRFTQERWLADLARVAVSGEPPAG